MKNKEEKDLKKYSRMIDDYAWHSQGDIIEIAKFAKKLGRDYMHDIIERKSAIIKDSKAIFF